MSISKGDVHLPRLEPATRVALDPLWWLLRLVRLSRHRWNQHPCRHRRQLQLQLRQGRRPLLSALAPLLLPLLRIPLHHRRHRQLEQLGLFNCKRFYIGHVSSGDDYHRR